jgi:hypothetical protein
MQNSLLIKWIVVIAIAFQACGDSSDSCRDPERTSGIILGKYAATCQPESSFGQFVITNQADLDSVFGTNLLQCNLPEINFENECILGFLTNASGCGVNFHRDVERVETIRRYLYSVTVESCGNCRSSFYSYNWVRVPALPPGWSVEFILR